MPPLTMEYTANVEFPMAMPEFVKNLNYSLATFETFDLEKIKSRAYQAENPVMGGDFTNKGFVYLQVQILPGRSESQIDGCMDHLLNFLKTNLLMINAHIQLHLSVEIKELTHYKVFLNSDKSAVNAHVL